MDASATAARERGLQQLAEQYEGRSDSQVTERKFRHRVAALARALARAGAPEMQRRFERTRVHKPKWYDKHRTVDGTEELASGWTVGEHVWGYHARDLDVRMPEPVFRRETTGQKMHTWVLEDGRLAYDGSIDGRDIGFDGDYEVIFQKLAAIAMRNGVEIPWNALE